MRLVLYSGGQNRENETLHDALYELCGRRKSARFTYVPFCVDNSKLFYTRITRRYRRFGFRNFDCFAVDHPFSKQQLTRALKGDVIYLAGGNTFYFLNQLKKSGMLPKLRRFAQNGGVLAGLSAGALIMTPSIQLAGIPKFDADENEVGLKDLSGLGLTHFEFSPHHTRNKNREKVLSQYSRKCKSPIYACVDGGGIVVNDDKLTAYGQTTVFHRGERFKL